MRSGLTSALLRLEAAPAELAPSVWGTLGLLWYPPYPAVRPSVSDAKEHRSAQSLVSFHRLPGGHEGHDHAGDRAPAPERLPAQPHHRGARADRYGHVRSVLEYPKRPWPPQAGQRKWLP